METNLLVEGRMANGKREIHVSFCHKRADKEIIISHDDNFRPLYAIISEVLIPMLMKEYKLEKAEATKLINKGLNCCGLSELNVPNVARVC
ncbi:MAG: hypothetical protein A2528_03525 [Candidatus Staskawiczbacteria bacterium RIFOXYD2_FULL_37_9]|uniref:Uncharacterized protein n=1 Tax=Candidatus Staskawiczbacteria bacterium RIFOXYB1_FULL_37_44 TaxID=1802223 RepID=A0A1G2ITR1_9BACT|nr:MAG: hypothetical protein A2358_02285 [Candidatus Staskawiczbacteria bacterium RIFOXYB1_FULL_37_44]OGZ82816.1 MAG: hypothetical protein A2416_03265 [Candidatus Staskawiczbacteria bacterium RIFOXYC1_FULL_37_52]OGZ88415.1 MAG: hypothetical protein A2444_03135 [Candidatus Staskawiczbacteria bacterium RIFOXYC2_FULL_37_19]OGZ90587.1 MAG: hypothetical protein A2581_02725 [Candidatus Staskawiczbacteria bacterium RIFOXYD1_FULL_37_110]OGZ93180.1 MAG: hypothetical protein A2528_03525 [Candidatus Stask